MKSINLQSNELQIKCILPFEGTKDVLKVLIDHNADINARDNKGNTALHLIARQRKNRGEH